MKIPDFAKNKIQDIRQRTGIALEEIMRDYKEVFNDPVTDARIDTSGPHTVEDKHKYTCMALWNSYIARPPAEGYTVVPIGHTSMRKAKSSGNVYSTIYALIKGDDGIQRIVCNGSRVAEQYKQVSLFQQYEVKLGQFKGGDYSADDRTKWTNPKRFMNPEKIMSRLEIPKHTVHELRNYPSQQRSDGYTDRTDWRCVEGFVARKQTFQRKDGTKGGVYTISDESCWDDEPQVNSQGDVIPPGLTCWTPPSLMVYEMNDVIRLYGSVNLQDNNEAQMNAYSIVPVHTGGDVQNEF